jgi:hypothetical protein
MKSHNTIQQIILLLFCLLQFSCTNQNSEKIDTEQEIRAVATEYVYKVTKTNNTPDNSYVQNTAQLRAKLKVIKENFAKAHIASFNKSMTQQSQEVISKLIDSMYLNISKKQHFSKSQSDDPPYTYSATFYFDNRWPCSNVAVTISYSVNSQGQVTGAEVTSYSYGYAMGNTYSQINSNIYYSGGSIVFQMNGMFNSSVGIGAFSLTNTNSAHYTGFIQLQGTPGGGGGFCKQEPNDQLVEANQ